MTIRPLLSALLVSAALAAGCATTPAGQNADGQEATAAHQNMCARATVGSRIRNCRSPGQTLDRSVMEQQIHRCTGPGCEGGE